MDTGESAIYGRPANHTLTETDAKTGVVVFANVTPGYRTIDGVVVETGKHFGTVSVWVDAGSATDFDFNPTP